MGLTYSEGIVKRDLESKGYDVIKVDKKGHPDFKIFDFEKNISMYVEVKRIESNILTDDQIKTFKTLKKTILIAVVKKGIIIYSDFVTKHKIMESIYNKDLMKIPNITCPKCNYKWLTSSKAKYVSCPSCLSKVEKTIEGEEK